MPETSKKNPYPQPLETLAYIPETHAIARAMAMNHINVDLKASQLRNGIGDDKMWACIGDVVHKQSLLMIMVPHQQIGLDLVAWYDEAWDVAAIRDRMRESIGASQPRPATQSDIQLQAELNPLGLGSF